MGRLFFSLGLVFVSLVVGYAWRRLVESDRLSQPRAGLEVWRRRMQESAIFLCLPLSAMLSLWGLRELDSRLLVLPFLGLSSWTCGALLALLGAVCLRLERAQAGSLVCCGAFSNIGVLGTLISVAFWGEQAIALAALYRICEEAIFFGVALPLARRFSPHAEREQPRADRRIYAALGLLALGLILNRAGVPRPEIGGTLASLVTLLATALFLVAVGLNLRLSRVSAHWRESALVVFIKSLAVPSVVTSLAWLLGCGELEGGLPLRVVAVLSSMPVAMNALVPPALYGLDSDLANSCWLVSTAALVLVAPVLALLLL